MDDIDMDAAAQASAAWIGIEPARPQHPAAPVPRDAESTPAEPALADRQELFRTLFEDAPDGILLLDPQHPSGRWPIVACNPAAARLHGYTREELLGQSIDLLTTVPGVPDRRAVYLETLRRVGTLRGEGCHRCNDGSLVSIEYLTTLITLDDRELVLSMERDITARQQALDQRQYEREVAHRLIRSSVDGIIAFDHACRYSLWNPGMERLTGLAQAAVLGKLAFEVFPFLVEIGEDVYFRDALAGHEVVARDRPFTIPATGRAGFFEAHYSPLYAETGEIIGGLGIVRDITARKQAEAEHAQLAREQAARAAAEVAQHRSAFLAEASMLLAASLEYETTLAQVAQLAVPALADWCVVDILAADGTVRPLAIAHSDPAEAARGWALQQRYPTDVEAAYGVAAVLRTRQPELYSVIPDHLLVALAQDAEHLDHLRSLGLTSAMIVPLIARGQLLGTLSFGVAKSGRRLDNTDLALAVELAQRAALAIDNARLYQEAQAALQARDEFLALAAHELKTPLGTLFSSVRLLQDQGARHAVRDPYAEELLGIARESAQHLVALVDALAAVAGLHSRGAQRADERVDLGGLARQVVAAVQRRLPAEQVELTCPDETLLIRGDAVQLEHVLGNLLQNALKYSPPGGRVWVCVERRGDAACVVVRDAGIGIPPADLPHLFERFYRARNAGQHARSGLGLGLYFVKEVVTRHGGLVEVASVEGQGSTFTVRLPLAVSGSEAAGR